MRGRGIATILRVRKAAHPRTRLFTRQTRAILSQCIVSASFKGAVRRTLRTKHSRQRTEKNRDSFKLRSISKTMARRWEAAGRQQRPRGALLAMLTAQNIGRAKGRGDDCDEPLKPRTTQPRRRGGVSIAGSCDRAAGKRENKLRTRTSAGAGTARTRVLAARDCFAPAGQLGGSPYKPVHHARLEKLRQRRRPARVLSHAVQRQRGGGGQPMCAILVGLPFRGRTCLAPSTGDE